VEKVAEEAGANVQEKNSVAMSFFPYGHGSTGRTLDRATRESTK
jgi:hypothetical protein